uniref:hypothetical protein n=1 Tax=Vibrio jasicida TaxID=766224 RepID=UPI001CA5C80D
MMQRYDHKDFGILSSSLISVLISPVLFLPIVIAALCRRRFYPFVLLALLLGIFSYQIVPDKSVDLSRWYQMFDYIKQFGLDAAKEFLDSKPDKLAYIYIYIL